MIGSFLDIFLGEFFGTAVLILLGNGVVANVVFKRTLGSTGGIIAITWGWALAVFAGVAIANVWTTGGFINPAVTMGQWVGGKITSTEAVIFMASQFAGALLGQIIVDIIYWNHIKDEKITSVLGMHSTAPTHDKAIFHNLFTEYIATMVLVGVVFLALSGYGGNWFAGAPFAVALVVLGIGLSLGGTTGYAINPARDLSPRIIHYLMYKTLPDKMNIKGQKITSNWKYSWVPVIAPFAAGVTMGGIWRLF